MDAHAAAHTPRIDGDDSIAADSNILHTDQTRVGGSGATSLSGSGLSGTGLRASGLSGRGGSRARASVHHATPDFQHDAREPAVSWTDDRTPMNPVELDLIIDACIRQEEDCTARVRAEQLLRRQEDTCAFLKRLASRMDFCVQLAADISQQYSDRCTVVQTTSGVLQLLIVLVMSITTDYLEAASNATPAAAFTSSTAFAQKDETAVEINFAVSVAVAVAATIGAVGLFVAQSMGWEKLASNISDIAAEARLTVRQLHQAAADSRLTQSSHDHEAFLQSVFHRELTAVLSVEEEFGRFVPESKLAQVLPAYSRNAVAVQTLFAQHRAVLEALHRAFVNNQPPPLAAAS